MALRYSALAASLLFLGASNATFAADLVVPAARSAEFVEQKFPGRQVDVNGISLGMEADTLKSLLKSKYPDTPYDTAMGSVRINYNGVNAQLDKFETGYRVSTKEDELLVISMSSPAIGSKVIGIQRDIPYRDPLKAPDMNTLADALIEKYGKPSGDRLPTNQPNETSRILTWYLKGTGDYSCPLNYRKAPLCEFSVSGTDGNPRNWQKALAAGLKVGIHVMLLPHNGGTKVKSFSLQMEDYTNTDLDNSTTESILKSGIDKGLATTKQSKPNL